MVRSRGARRRTSRSYESRFRSRRGRRRGGEVRLPRPASAELLLLELAKELAALARDAEPARALSLPLQRLADCLRHGSESLPHEVFRAWVRSRSDKTAALALSWAREQVRLGLQEVVERAKGARSRIELDSETLRLASPRRVRGDCSGAAVGGGGSRPRADAAHRSRPRRRLKPSRIRKATPAPSVTRLTWIESRCVRREHRVVARAPRRLGSRHQHGRRPDQHRHHERGERGTEQRPQAARLAGDACSAEATSAIPLSASPQRE